MTKEDDALRRNLIDAGCDSATIALYFACASDCERKRLLSQQRARLLDDYHRDCRRLDCLDFLVTKLNHKQAP